MNVGGAVSVSSGSFSGSWENTNATTTDPTKVATSTTKSLGDANYIKPGAASSTLEIDIENSDNIFLTLFMHSSTTPPTLQYVAYYTYDDIASTTGWYAGTSLSGSTYTATERRTLTYASSSEYQLLIAPTHRAKKMKIEWSLTGAAADVLLDVYHK